MKQPLAPRRAALRLLGALAGGSLLPTARAADATPRWLQPGPAIPDVTLLDDRRRAYRLPALLAGRPVAVGFFYTGCSAVCPPQTATFRALQSVLKERAVQALLLSVSLDPLADTPQALGDYAARFGARLGLDQGWLMLTGAPAPLARVWAAFDSASGRPEDHPATMWIGCADRRRWMRTAGLASPDRLADWLAASLS